MSTGIEPHSVGRYQVVSELGRGAMGVVFKAIDPNIGRTVALKTLRLDALGIESEDVVRRFKNEARSAGVMNHPNIVTIYDAGEIHGIFYIAMEFIEGTTLQALMAQQRVLPVDRIITLSRQICAGLDYAHSHGVIHRDVKPANMMITSDGTVKIMDFGIAKAGGGMTSTGQVLGTPNYMSPEQVKGRTLDGRSDLFSFGVMLYEMITGEKPFMGQNITTIIYKIVNENPVSPRELDVTVHPGLSAIITKALAKSPDERYQSGAEMMRDLESYKNLGSGVAPGFNAGAATTVMPAMASGDDQTQLLNNAVPTPAAPIEAQPPSPIAPSASTVAAAAASAARIASESPTLDQPASPPAKAQVAAAPVAAKSVEAAKKAPQPAPRKPGVAHPPGKAGAAMQRYMLIGLALLVLIAGWVFARRGSKKSSGQSAAAQPAPVTPAPSQQASSSAQQPPAIPQKDSPQGIKNGAAPSTAPGGASAQPATAPGAVQQGAAGQNPPPTTATPAPGTVSAGATPQPAVKTQATKPEDLALQKKIAADKKLAASLAARNRNFRPAGKTLPAQPGAPQSENPVLAATNAMGVAGLTGMSVVSTPDGARVAIDGVSQAGWRTPFQIGKLAPGRHSVSFSKPGYTEETRAVMVLAGKMASVGVQLKAKVAIVSLSTNPSGAAVLVDGKSTSRVTPTEVAIEQGDHILTLRLTGYKDTTFHATIGEAQSYSFKPRMVKESAAPTPPGGPNPFAKIGHLFGGGIPQGKGRLSIRTNPPGAEITVEGHPAPRKTPSKFPLEPGTYQVTLTLRGYKSLHKTVTVQEGKTAEILDTFEAQ